MGEHDVTAGIDMEEDDNDGAEDLEVLDDAVPEGLLDEGVDDLHGSDDWLVSGFLVSSLLWTALLEEVLAASASCSSVPVHENK